VLTNVAVRTADGAVDLATKWSRGPLVVGYHHLRCDMCQLAGIELSCLAPRIAVLGGEIVIVYPDQVDEVARTCAERRTQAVCASDSRGVLRRLAGKCDAPGRGPATFVVDRSGRVVYLHSTHSMNASTRMGGVADAVRAAHDAP
jgi:peroxiredoxin